MDDYISLAYIIIQILIGIAQLILSIKFFRDTKKIKDVGTLPKVMIVFANISTIRFLVDIAYQYGGEIGLPLRIVLTAIGDVAMLAKYTSWIFWMRMLNVQVQLRA